MRRRIALLLLLAGAAATPASALTSEEARTKSFELLNEGVRAYQKGEFLKAEQTLLRSYDIHLNNFRAAYYLGLARMGARKYEEALPPLGRALEYRPLDLPARVSLGEAHLALGDLASARTEFYRALEVREDFSPAFDGLARLAEASGNPGRARELFRQAIDADAGNPDPHMNLGIMALRQNRLDEAVTELARAVTLRPDYAKALGMLARVRIRLGQHNDALLAARRAIEIEPGNPAHTEALGRVYFALADLRRAEEAHRAALALDPDYVEASDGLAQALRAQGRFAEAGEALEAAAARERTDATLAEQFRRRARTYRYEEGKLDRLRAALNDPGEGEVETGESDAPYTGDTDPDLAVPEPETGKPVPEPETGELVPTEPAVPPPATAADLTELARLSASVQDWSTAARAADRAAGLEPEDDTLARLRAYFLLQAGRVIEARDGYAALEAAGRASPEDLLNLGVAHSRLGDDEGAAGAYRRARDTGFAPPEADLFLGLALERTGRREEARAALDRYMERAGESGDTVARVRHYLEIVGRPSVPSHEEVFGDDPEDGDDETGDEDAAGEDRP